MKPPTHFIGLCAIISLMFLSSGLIAAAEQTPGDVLKAQGLSLAEQRYVLPTDAGLMGWLQLVRASERKVQDAIRRRSNLEHDIKALEATADALYARWEAEKEKLGKIGKGADVSYNMQVERVNALRLQILEAMDLIKKRTAVMQSIEDPSDEYVAITMKFGSAIDATMQKYAALASDAQVKSAIDTLTRTSGVKYALGPSERLRTELPEIRRLIDRVNSDTINFEFEGGVPTVPVTLNGTLTIHAVVDSGAAAVTLSDKIARQLGIAPGPNDRITQMVTADGTVAQVHVMVIKSIRLGKFSVDDIECMVQPDNGKNTDTLLGGTFLRRFVYRMDLAAGQLKLSQISDATISDSPAPVASGPSPEASPPRPKTSTPKPEISTPKPNDAQPTGIITIVKAEYGRDAKWVDVTEALRAGIKRDPFTPIGGDDNLLGNKPDPAPGRSKSLHVTYLVDQEKHDETIEEGHSHLLAKYPAEGILDPSAGQGLKITGARYGAGMTWMDVTRVVRSKVSDPAQPFDLTNSEIGRDPVPQRQKKLVVWFSYRGRDYVTVAPEYYDLHNVRLIKQ
jgi:clan AA aspartic protease (TIGR02281 family)